MGHHGRRYRVGKAGHLQNQEPAEGGGDMVHAEEGGEEEKKEKEGKNGGNKRAQRRGAVHRRTGRGEK